MQVFSLWLIKPKLNHKLNMQLFSLWLIKPKLNPKLNISMCSCWLTEHASCWSNISSVTEAHNTPSRLSDLKRTMFKRALKFPILKGKGAEIKHFAKPLHSVFEQYMGASCLQDRQIFAGLTACLDMEHLLDTHKDDYIMPKTAAAEFKDATHRFFQLNTIVGQHFHPMLTKLFHHTIKFHGLLHLGLIAAFMNPRMGSCFAGEDLMHKIKMIVQSCQSGSGGHVLVSKVMSKYVQGFGLSLLNNVWRRWKQYVHNYVKYLDVTHPDWTMHAWLSHGWLLALTVPVRVYSSRWLLALDVHVRV